MIPLFIDIVGFESHQPNLWSNSHHTGSVPGGGDDAGACGSVAIFIEGIAGRVPGVDAVDVIDVAVAVIVDAVARDLARIPPHVGGQVGMGGVDARVDDRHQHRGGPQAQVPGLGGLDVGAGDGAHILTCVPECPLTPEVRLFGDDVLELHFVVGFGVDHLLQAIQGLDGVGDAVLGVDSQDPGLQVGESALR